MWVGALTNTAYNTTYKINMLNDHDDFTFTGEKYNPLLYSIQIEQGYNWISYLPDESLEIEEALQSITIPNNTCLKTQNRSAVYFGAWIGDMQVMQPGKGYLLSWPEEPEDPLFLTYPPASETSRIDLALDHFSNLDNWQLARGYESNMILMSKISAESILITDDQNYSVGVFDDNGVCRSIGKLQNEFWYFTIVGDVPELLELRLYNGFSHSTSTATESVLYEANAVIGSPDKLNQIDFKTGEIVPDTPQNLILKGNYPNPFNPSTMFSYALPNSGQVSLKVYNSKGQLVENLVDGFQNAGEYNMEWDAAAQSSGIYFYKLCFEDQQITRKCILMK
jgi:hypothetical protein